MSLSRLTGVIASDQKTTREIVIAALRTVGVRNFCEAEDGGEAFAIVVGIKPHFVILDFEVELDSIRVLSAIRRSPDSPNIQMPVIVLTANVERNLIFTMRDAGANDIITKPLSFATISSRVAAVVRRPRRFISADNYVGPCRRRGLARDYHGPLRRESDSPDEEMVLD